jgi:peptidoglycan/LPS O-acetylase OafA/YrhL
MGKFRSDVEGLRGIAVLMVVLAHAGTPLASGGFVGVDVFFVVSGYLITGLLVAELTQQGGVSFWDFYARRVRRLMPAMAFMTIGVLWLAIWLTPEPAWGEQAGAMYWAALWLSNLYFSFASFEYFGQQATENLFLHTWSLGVEEQFYLIWPAFLLLFWKIAGIRGLRIGLLLIVIGGLGLTLWMTTKWPLQAYYMTPARIWQLGAGGLIQFLPTMQRCSLRTVGVVRVLGLLMLFICTVWLDPGRISYPGAWALLPTLATMLLLAPGNAGWVNQMLDNAMTRFLGGVSYSWYLWHWPLLILAFGIWGQSVSIGWQVAGASLLPAWLSRRFLEMPWLRITVERPRYWVMWGLLTSLGLVFAAMQWQSSAQQAAVSAPEVDPALTANATRLYSDYRCDEWYRASRVVACEMVTAESPGAPVMVLIGDSVGAQWEPALSIIAQRRGWSFQVLTKSACALVDRPFVYTRIKRRYVECETWRDGVVDYLDKLRPRLIIMGSSSAYSGISVDDWRDGTRDFLHRIASVGADVFVMAPTPVLSFSPLSCASKETVSVANFCAAELSNLKADKVINALVMAAAGMQGVRMVDMADQICPGGLCVPIVNNVLTYQDAQHLDATFVEAMSPELEARIFSEAKREVP